MELRWFPNPSFQATSKHLKWNWAGTIARNDPIPFLNKLTKPSLRVFSFSFVQRSLSLSAFFIVGVVSSLKDFGGGGGGCLWIFCKFWAFFTTLREKWCICLWLKLQNSINSTFGVIERKEDNVDMTLLHVTSLSSPCQLPLSYTVEGHIYRLQMLIVAVSDVALGAGLTILATYWLCEIIDPCDPFEDIGIVDPRELSLGIAGSWSLVTHFGDCWTIDPGHPLLWLQDHWSSQPILGSAVSHACDTLQIVRFFDPDTGLIATLFKLHNVSYIYIKIVFIHRI